MNIWQENIEWLNAFRERYGRSPRVLHISNVANNAYNNAKILAECGLDNHVIACNDNYAMGCPEWEDADFDGDIEDLWHPNWSARNLRGFKRPAWFAQGGHAEAASYLQSLCHRAEVPLNNLQSSDAQNNSAAPRPLRRLKGLLVNRCGRVLKRIDGFWGTNIFELAQECRAKVHRVLHPSTHGEWEVDKYLVAAFKKEFPSRQDSLTLGDFSCFYYSRRMFRELLNNYDIVIGYAVEGIYPLMAGRSYIAFEHGTIRDIPYMGDTQGRICALTYRMADHVLVTNIDCRQSAEFLAPGRYTMINHPFDEDHGMLVDGWQALRAELLCQLDAEFLFFFPTRHDWVAGEGYADKANDVFLRAFINLRQRGLKVGAVFCEWGRNVDHSKALLDDVQLNGYVRWVKPMGVIRFERYCRASDIVVDQFKLGSFGGIVFKAMAVGAPILTYLDEAQILRHYPEVPPVVNCRTTDEICIAISELIADADRLKILSEESQKWIKTWHGKEQTANLQLKVFSAMTNNLRK